ncbi:ABC transporter ATP-binding protein [Clostridium polynesiense]|uniref:ABC transporter ATP-binding protein n=1 Tax=Clostridium polynesiense TaxID=1325933 RepID=UPI00058BD4F2|nr:ABC transporter ATP-binding protein [Clostridium polynesiense]
MLKVERLNKSFGGFKALENISFEIREGSIHGFLGRNGAGKTTTMNILAGILNYESGSIIYRDKSYERNKSTILKNIGYSPQEHHFYDYMTAEEYLRFLAKITKLNSREARSRIEMFLEFMNLKEQGRKLIGQYSGGMKQKLSIISAIFNNPEFIILDEPTSALDPEGRAEILEFVLKLKNQGSTVFLSTHILNDVERICDYITIIEKGRILVTEELKVLKEKYIKPIYDVEIEGDLENIAHRLSDFYWIEDIIVEKERLSVLFKDNDAGRRQLIPEIIKAGGIIKSYNLRNMSMEDIFKRTVGDNEQL